jgi:hypothetical protein
MLADLTICFMFPPAAVVEPERLEATAALRLRAVEAMAYKARSLAQPLTTQAVAVLAPTEAAAIQLQKLFITEHPAALAGVVLRLAAGKLRLQTAL